MLEGGKDVTATFDLATFGTATANTHGPEKPEYKFDKTLGLDAKSLETAIERLSDDWHLPSKPGYGA